MVVTMIFDDTSFCIEFLMSLDRRTCLKVVSAFSHILKIGNININANFVFPYIFYLIWSIIC